VMTADLPYIFSIALHSERRVKYRRNATGLSTFPFVSVGHQISALSFRFDFSTSLDLNFCNFVSVLPPGHAGPDKPSRLILRFQARVVRSAYNLEQCGAIRRRPQLIPRGRTNP
jgi:hypothetical protein